jgi:hypothetical protein
MVVENIFSFLFHGNNKRTTGEDRKAKSSVKICHEEAYTCHILQSYNLQILSCC